MCGVYNIFDLLSVQTLWGPDGLSQSCSGDVAVFGLWVCAVLNSLHTQHLTRPYSPRSQWHMLAECWAQTSAQTWRSQTRGWKSRSESYCFIGWGCCDSTRGLWTLNRYIRCHLAAAGTERGFGGASVQQKVLFQDKLSVIRDHSFTHSRSQDMVYILQWIRTWFLNAACLGWHKLLGVLWQVTQPNWALAFSSVKWRYPLIAD